MIPEWEKSQKIIGKLEEHLKVIFNEINKIKDDSYCKNILIFVKSIQEKIEKFHKVVEFENSLTKK